MSQHPKPRWTVGPHWNSVRPRPAGSSSPVVHHGMHTSYLNAISRPDLHPFPKDDLVPPRPHPPGAKGATATAPPPPPPNDPSAAAAAESSPEGPAGVPPQHLEHHRQQQLYLQQLELMQKLQTMPGSTTRLWYPTFGPTVTTTCSDSTILLDNPQQYTLNNNAKLNRQAVGPHWRSIPTYSPASSSTPTSPQPHSQAMATATTSSSSPMSAMSALYAASINQVRAASFRLQDEPADQVMSDAARPSGAPAATVPSNYITGHYAGAVRYPSSAREPLPYHHSHPHPTYPYYINTTPTYRDRAELTALSTAMSRSTSQTSNASMESSSTALTSAGRPDMKRKAPWEEEEEEGFSEESILEEPQDQQNYHQRHEDHQGDQTVCTTAGLGLAQPSSVTQFVPVTQIEAAIVPATSPSVTAPSSLPGQQQQQQQHLDLDTEMASDTTPVMGDQITRAMGQACVHDIYAQDSSRPINGYHPSQSYQMHVDMDDPITEHAGGDLGKLKARPSLQQRALILGMPPSGSTGALGALQQLATESHLLQHHHRHHHHDGSSLMGDSAGHDQSQSRPTVQPRRTRIRRESDESDLAAEARRRQGEVVRDIFQECFYNAAASHQ